MPVSVDHIIEALSSLGGEAHLSDIVARVLEIAPPPLPADVGASVRGRIQERCSQTASYLGRADLFYSVHGIEARRGEWGLRTEADALSPDNSDSVQDGSDAFLDSPEGRAELRIHLRRERSRELIRRFKESLASFECEACGFDYETYYGPIGRGYIEAHHTIPVASLIEGARTKLSELAALCANCHRMVHRNGLMPVADLRRLRKPISASHQRTSKSDPR